MEDNITRHNVKPERPQYFEHWQWFQYVNRYWMKYLSPSEFMLLSFIMDRTLGWKKRREVITRRHMLKGIASDGTIYHLGTSLSPTTIDTTLNKLEERGFLTRTSITRGVTTYVEFEVNLDWTPETLPRRLRKPRRKR